MNGKEGAESSDIHSLGLSSLHPGGELVEFPCKAQMCFL